jgi:membrane protein DedA with SNARE-associated domain
MNVLKHRPFRSFVTPEHVAQMEIQFDKRGNWIIFFGRFFAGIRSVMCVTAGLCKVPMWKFVLIDFSGALCTVPLLVSIGWFFSKNIEHVIKGVGAAEKVIGAVVAIVVIGWVLYIHVSKRSKIHQVDKGTKQALKGQVHDASRTSSEVRADDKADNSKI